MKKTDVGLMKQESKTPSPLWSKKAFQSLAIAVLSALLVFLTANAGEPGAEGTTPGSQCQEYWLRAPIPSP